MEDAPSINRILLPGQQSEAPSVPEGFREKLRQYDPTLCVSWNTFKKRFVIEQCVRHNSDTAEHTHVCLRNYVLLVQDPEGCMLGLGEKVIEMIAQRDVTKAGYGPDDLDRFIRDMRNKRQEHYQKTERKMDQVIGEGARDNRRQLLKAVHLIQQHNLTPNR